MLAIVLACVSLAPRLVPITCLPLAASAPEHIRAEATPPGLTARDWSSIHAAYDAERHAARRVDGGFQACNPGQQWLTRFDERGFTTTPDDGDWTWGLELVRYGFAGSEREIADAGAMSAQGGHVVCTRDAELTEWYVNDSRGLEHGYTLRRRPPADQGALAFMLAIRGGLTPEVSEDGRSVRFVDGAGRAALDYSGLIVTDADGCPLAARFEVVPEGLRLEVDDRGARYPLTVDPIAQQAYLKASNTGASDSFGSAVAVSGDTAVVTAPLEDSNATGVNGDESNNSAASAGAAYVFVRSGSTWTQQAYLKASNTDAGDQFGTSAAISGDTLVIGAVFEESSATGVNGDQNDDNSPGAGAAYVFVRSGTTWSQQAYLKASNNSMDPFQGDEFGSSVAIDGDTIAVTAPGENSDSTGVNGDETNSGALFSGSAYVFVRSGTTWTQQAYVKASNTDAFDRFGESVALSADTLIVGAPSESSNATGVNGDESNDSLASAGAAYVYVRSGTTWTQQAYLKASNTGGNDQFGTAVGLDGDVAVVGALNEDSSATGIDGNGADNSVSNSGAAYVFARSGTTWTQQAYVKASNTGASDAFGAQVAASGERVLVGAASEDSNATGIDGNESDNSASGAGAAYLFERSGSTWSQLAYLKASNTGASDAFGVSVAMDGDTIVIGANAEDSNATGVGGNQSDNSSSGSGAAYVITATSEIVSYCFGDDLDPVVTADCPCTNFGAAGRGCANSFSSLGGLLTATGTTSPNTILFTVSEIPNNTLTVGFRTTANATPQGVVYGDGVRCQTGTLIRFAAHNSGTGGDPANGWTASPATVGAGLTRYYQIQYRNSAPAFCPPETFNITNGVILNW